MSREDSRLALVRDRAQFAMRELGQARGGPFGFDRDSVVRVEGFIERERPRFADEEARGGLVSVLGISGGDGRQ